MTVINGINENLQDRSRILGDKLKIFEEKVRDLPENPDLYKSQGYLDLIFNEVKKTILLSSSREKMEFEFNEADFYDPKNGIKYNFSNHNSCSSYKYVSVSSNRGRDFSIYYNKKRVFRYDEEKYFLKSDEEEYSLRGIIPRDFLEVTKRLVPSHRY